MERFTPLYAIVNNIYMENLRFKALYYQVFPRYFIKEINRRHFPARSHTLLKHSCKFWRIRTSIYPFSINYDLSHSPKLAIVFL